MFSDAATGLAGMAHILSHHATAANTVHARRSPLTQKAAARSLARLATTSPTCHGSSTMRTPPATAGLARVVHTRSVDTTTAHIVRARRWPSVHTLATSKHARLAPASQTPATTQSRQPTCLRAPSTHSLACLVVCVAAADVQRWIRFRAADETDNTAGSERAADAGARQMGGCRPGHRPCYTDMPRPRSPSPTIAPHARCTHVAARGRTVSVQNCDARRGTTNFTFPTTHPLQHSGPRPCGLFISVCIADLGSIVLFGLCELFAKTDYWTRGAIAWEEKLREDILPARRFSARVEQNKKTD